MWGKSNIIKVPCNYSFFTFFMLLTYVNILLKKSFTSMQCVGLQIYKMINLGSNVIVYKLKHCVLHFEVNMMTF